jgi:hypothetical protein
VELSWMMRLRIAAAVATGVILIGFLAWPLAAPAEPFGAVLAGNISLNSKIVLAGLAFLAGFIAYFLSWPYGREIGVLAVPSGLAFWAVRCRSMAGLMQMNPTLAQRQALFAHLKWEPLFWLGIVAAGFAGVLLARKIRSKPEPDEVKKKANSKSNIYLNAAIAVIGSGLIAQFCIRVLAQDVRIGSFVAQPAVAQIAFAVLISFGLAAFVVKKFLDVSYIWPTIAGALVTGFAVTSYLKQDVLQHLVQRWPATFFPNAVIAILPVQMVAFGALGSIAGYWLAVRYNYWRKHG